MNRKSQILSLAICLLTLGLMATSARADVTYTFSGINNGDGGDGQSVAFQYTSANFVTSFTSLKQSQLNSCTHCQISPNSPDVYLAPNIPYFGDALQFNDSNNNPSYYLFSAGAFDAAGTYHSSSGELVSSGTLKVAVPEPSSVALTLAGGMMLALFACFRRKSVTAGQLA